MAKVTGCTVVHKNEEDILELHVHGDRLPSSAFLEILAILEKNHKQKEVDFVAYSPVMLLLLRQAVPTEYYRKLELKSYADTVQPYPDAV